MKEFTDKELKAIGVAKSELAECAEQYDVESAHGWADSILCELLIELGLTDVVNAYDNVEKWYA